MSESIKSYRRKINNCQAQLGPKKTQDAPEIRPNQKDEEQAGAELGQAQPKLRLDQVIKYKNLA